MVFEIRSTKYEFVVWLLYYHGWDYLASSKYTPIISKSTLKNT